MNAMSNPDYHHGDLREALLDAAEAGLQKNPRLSLSIRALASELGVSATAPHAHFRTKADLLAALATRGFEKLRKRTARRSEKIKAPDKKLAAQAEAYLQFSLENAGLYRIMFATGVDTEAHPALHAASRASYAILQSAVAEALPTYSLAERDKRALAAWSIVHGLASLLSEGRLANDIAADKSPKALAKIAANLIAQK